MCGGTDGGASAFALTFVKEMEESTIPNNRPTEPAAELIADQDIARRDRVAPGVEPPLIVEPGIGIQNRIPVKIE